MNRRGFLACSGFTALTGCIGSFGSGEPRFDGPTEEDPDEVDVRYRRFTEDEVRSITSSAQEIPYDDLLSNIESYVGTPIVFGGTVIVINELDDHFVYQISMAGNPNQLQWAFASWTGRGVEEASRVTCWGEVLGPEIFTQGMGEELTVPAIAIADIEVA